MDQVKKISKAWVLTPIAMFILFVFWMFQGVGLDRKDVTDKENFNHVFTNYYDKDEGITFEVLSEESYKNVALTAEDVQERANLYLKEKKVNLNDFSLLIDQGIYTNMGLGLADIIAWRVMFIDEKAEIEETAKENQTIEQIETNQVDELERAEKSNIDSAEQKLRYWIVLDAQTGKILSAYANGH